MSGRKLSCVKNDVQFCFCFLPDVRYLPSAAYVFISFRLFNLTNTFKNAAVPHSNDTLLLRNVLLMAVVGGGMYLAVWGVMAVI